MVGLSSHTKHVAALGARRRRRVCRGVDGAYAHATPMGVQNNRGTTNNAGKLRKKAQGFTSWLMSKAARDAAFTAPECDKNSIFEFQGGLRITSDLAGVL